MFISDEELNKISQGQKLNEDYLNAINVKGEKTIGDINRLNNGLKELGFNTYENYLKFRTLMNIKEADRCYRMRMISDTSKTFVCDSCTGRYLPYFQMQRVCEDYNKSNIKESYISNDDSELVQDQVQYCKNNNITPVYFPRAIDIFYFVDLLNHSPLHCLATPVKIFEPRFNIFHGMEEFSKLGISLEAMRKKEWERK